MKTLANVSFFLFFKYLLIYVFACAVPELCDMRSLIADHSLFSCSLWIQ